MDEALEDAPSPTTKRRGGVMSDGPEENKVRATYATRNAGILEIVGRDAVRCFNGLFNGASKHSAWVTSDGRFFCGKAECEWGWPDSWEKLRDAGLIEFSTEREDYKGPQGGFRINVKWTITHKGWSVREDDLAYFRELMDARRRDEAAFAPPQASRGGVMSEISTSYAFSGSFQMDASIHHAVGRPSDFSGSGFGQRDLGWIVQSDVDAARIARGLKKLNLPCVKR